MDGTAEHLGNGLVRVVIASRAPLPFMLVLYPALDRRLELRHIDRLRVRQPVQPRIAIIVSEAPLVL